LTSTTPDEPTLPPPQQQQQVEENASGNPDAIDRNAIWVFWSIFIVWITGAILLAYFSSLLFMNLWIWLAFPILIIISICFEFISKIWFHLRTTWWQAAMPQTTEP